VNDSDSTIGYIGRLADRMQILPMYGTLLWQPVFWLSMGYNFGSVIASDTLFDSRGGFSGSSYPMKTADFEVLRDIATANIFWFLYMLCTLVPPGEYD